MRVEPAASQLRVRCCTIRPATLGYLLTYLLTYFYLVNYYQDVWMQYVQMSAVLLLMLARVRNLLHAGTTAHQMDTATSSFTEVVRATATGS